MLYNVFKPYYKKTCLQKQKNSTPVYSLCFNVINKNGAMTSCHCADRAQMRPEEMLFKTPSEQLKTGSTETASPGHPATSAGTCGGDPPASLL